MLSRWLRSAMIAASLITPGRGQGITLDLTQPDSIKSAAKTCATNLMTYYTGNQPGQIPGLLPQPYYWWEAGAMFGQLIHYWYLTGDTQYNDIVKQALLFQIGDDANYMPTNQSKDLGNDDQSFWAFSAMDAAELGFENPDSKYPSWVALAQAVWNTQIPSRWETSTCGGGLRWQIFPFNAGYDYKNTVANAALFQLSARLARYTGNQTYVDWAEKSWDWIFASPLMSSKYESVWDGTRMTDNCTTATETYWTYNVGQMIIGAAYMYNYTNGNQTWLDRVTNLQQATNVFFVQSAGVNQPPKEPPGGGNIMCEVACETPEPQTCNYDQPSFKAYFSRWLAVTSQLVPSLEPNITIRLQQSAQAAAVQCSGQNRNMCGRRWYQTVWDGQFGVGEQMSALSVFQNNLIKSVAPPITLNTGGTSQQDGAAGSGTGTTDSLINNPDLTNPITTGDKAGAGILTVLSLGLVVGGTSWMVL